MTQYIVKWANSRTGATGHGSPVDYDTAQSWVEMGNKEHPDFTHWLEPVEEKPAYEPSNWGQPGFAKNRNKQRHGRTR